MRLFKFFGGIVLIVGAAFILPPLYFLAGAFSGWLIGSLFEQTFTTTLLWLELPLAAWQVGGMLGFVAGLFSGVGSRK